ncbi:MAG: hypothetical protein HQK57_00615 [Deltaproteobacteria bacterium]|nr:hypothetical protein [Deltaproteobacteria bacterium]
MSIRGKVHSIYLGRQFDEEMARAKIVAKMDQLSKDGIVADLAKDGMMDNGSEGRDHD